MSSNKDFQIKRNKNKEKLTFYNQIKTSSSKITDLKMDILDLITKKQIHFNKLYSKFLNLNENSYFHKGEITSNNDASNKSKIHFLSKSQKVIKNKESQTGNLNENTDYNTESIYGNIYDKTFNSNRKFEVKSIQNLKTCLNFNKRKSKKIKDTDMTNRTNETIEINENIQNNIYQEEPEARQNNNQQKVHGSYNKTYTNILNNNTITSLKNNSLKNFQSQFSDAFPNGKRNKTRNFCQEENSQSIIINTLNNLNLLNTGTVNNNNTTSIVNIENEKKTQKSILILKGIDNNRINNKDHIKNKNVVIPLLITNRKNTFSKESIVSNKVLTNEANEKKEIKNDNENEKSTLSKIYSSFTKIQGDLLVMNQKTYKSSLKNLYKKPISKNHQYNQCNQYNQCSHDENHVNSTNSSNQMKTIKTKSSYNIKSSFNTSRKSLSNMVISNKPVTEPENFNHTKTEVSEEYDFLNYLRINHKQPDLLNKFLVNKVKLKYNSLTPHAFISNNLAKVVTYGEIISKMNDIQAFKVGERINENYLNYSKELNLDVNYNNSQNVKKMIKHTNLSFKELMKKSFVEKRFLNKINQKNIIMRDKVKGIDIDN